LEDPFFPVTGECFASARKGGPKNNEIEKRNNEQRDTLLRDYVFFDAYPTTVIVIEVLGNPVPRYSAFSV
jgi:hypothetical protein